MITVAPSTSFEAVIDTGITGLVGTIGTVINDNQGVNTAPFDSTRILEIAHGVYSATSRTSPTAPGDYTIIWQLGDPGDVLGVDDLTVAGDAPPPPPPPPPGTSSLPIGHLFQHKTNDLSATGGKFNVPSAGSATSPLWIQGDPVDYDGATEICVEAYIAAIEADFQAAILTDLYVNGTLVGTLIDESTGNSSTTGNRGGKTGTGRYYFTPPAGTTTCSLRVWATSGTTNNVWSGANPVGATDPDTSPFYLPAYMRITKAS